MYNTISCQRRGKRCYYCSTISTCMCFFPSLFVQSDLTPAERVYGLRGCCTSRSLLFHSGAARSASAARGSRLSVRMQRPPPPSSWVVLYSDCVSVPRPSASTAVKWIIHSSGESISEQQLLLPRRQALLYLPLNGARRYRERYPVRSLHIDRIHGLSARQCPRSVITGGCKKGPQWRVRVCERVEGAW